ncbi:MAG: ATP-binding protein [Armatimonadetes bacterium]|nr:ATP-binding protein [Armatimonadota bacterium]
MDNILPIHLYRAEYTGAVISKLKACFPTLEAEWASGSHQANFFVGGLSPRDAAYLQNDLRFYDLNPFIPLENLCSRLDNYQPKNESQEAMLHFANKLVELNDDSMGAGLYMYGEAGIGKSHIAVGISKQFMLRGLQPSFQPADRYTFSQQLDLGPGQAWIIDDLNSGFGMASRLFKSVMLNAHERGGRVFITSNKPYEEMLKEMMVGDSPANRVRYDDRTRSMMKVLHVTGQSYRQQKAWYLE